MASAQPSYAPAESERHNAFDNDHYSGDDNVSDDDMDRIEPRGRHVPAGGSFHDKYDPRCRRCQRQGTDCDTRIPSCIKCRIQGKRCRYRDPFTGRQLRRGQLEDLERTLFETKKEMKTLKDEKARLESTNNHLNRLGGYYNQQNRVAVSALPVPNALNQQPYAPPGLPAALTLERHPNNRSPYPLQYGPAVPYRQAQPQLSVYYTHSSGFQQQQQALQPQLQMDQPPPPEGPQWGLGTQTVMYAPNQGFQVPIGSQATQLGNPPQEYLHGDGRPPSNAFANFDPGPGPI